MKLEKAEIIVLNEAGRPAKSIRVMYNPTEIGVQTSAEVSGEGSNVQFERVQESDFSVSLFYDTYESGTDVSRAIAPITALLQPTVGGQVRRRPPVCLFRWGSFEYRGIVVAVDRRFTMFLPSGNPVRATVGVTFKSVLTPVQEEKETGRDACRQLWTVRAGDRLDLIAAETLGDAGAWRLIAEANAIRDPLLFPLPHDLGRVLAIPDVNHA